MAARFEDPAFPQQWHLHNTAPHGLDLNVLRVWERNVTGRGVSPAGGRGGCGRGEGWVRLGRGESSPGGGVGPAGEGWVQPEGGEGPSCQTSDLFLRCS